MASHDDAPALTVDELAAELRVNRKAVYAAIARGEIPGARRVGRTIRISRRAFNEWFSSGSAADGGEVAAGNG